MPRGYAGAVAGSQDCAVRSPTVTVCCCGALSFLRLGHRKERPLCHVCAGVVVADKPGKAGVVELGWVSASGRMHHSAVRTSPMSAGGVAVLRPPKPPCWRDFVAQDTRRCYPPAYLPVDLRSGHGGDHFPGIGGVAGVDPLDVLGLSGRSGGGGGGGSGTARTSKGGKRLRARIHRTRSEHLIHVEDLPDGELTVSLAETRPHELRLGERPAADLDDRLYVEENNRRCQSWLASIEAAEPLDDIGYTKGKNDDQVALEDVDVEVPEETFLWDDDEEEEDEEDEDEDERQEGDEEGDEADEADIVELRPSFNTSASSSDNQGLLQRVLAAGASYVVCCDEGKGQGSCDQTSRKSSSGNRRDRQGGREGGLRATSSSRDVHGKLSNKRILSIPEHPSIE